MKDNKNKQEEDKKKTPWWNRSILKIYFCHTLSSWGDRMWNFAVGLYMVILFPESLIVSCKLLCEIICQHANL